MNVTYLDSLIRLKNANLKKNKKVILKFSEMTKNILFKLQFHKFIKKFA